MATIEIQMKNNRIALTITNTQKQRYSFTATIGKQLTFVFGEAIDSLCEPDPLWTPRSSKGLPFYPESCTATQLPYQNTLLHPPTEQLLPSGPESLNDASS